jgi:hypothetical protein
VRGATIAYLRIGETEDDDPRGEPPAGRHGERMDFRVGVAVSERHNHRKDSDAQRDDGHDGGYGQARHAPGETAREHGEGAETHHHFPLAQHVHPAVLVFPIHRFREEACGYFAPSI